MHGHSFKVVLSLKGDLDTKIGWVLDYHQITKIMAPILLKLDHKVLNEVAGLENPTSELLAKWIYDQTKTQISILENVTIMETSTTECTYPV